MNTSRLFVLGYRPELDGLRALAVIAVMLLHLGLYLPNGFRIASGGQAGVTLFFVLSGFLITSLLLEEWDARATLDLGSFYFRRFLRLVPALVVLLVATGILGSIASLHPRGNTLPNTTTMLYVVFYVSNWFHINHPLALGTLKPTWSLGVEEQFYILWPVCLLILLHFGIQSRRLLGLVVCGIVASTALRVLMVANGVSMYRIILGSDTRADSLLFGCALSIIVRTYQIDLGCWPNLVAPSGLAMWVAVVTLTPVMLENSSGYLKYSDLPSFSFSALGSMILIGGLVLTNQTMMHRALSCPALVWIGKRSYGMYLWNVTVYACTPAFGLSGYWLQGMIFLATLVPVIVSYKLVERPALRLKSRFRPSPAPSASIIDVRPMS
jgi:peptidoglycan/LPS O-acetylase OafA/YrhL